MTVAALAPSIQYLEDGVSLAFPVPFRFNAPAHIAARRQFAVDSSVLELVYGVDYSVTGGTTDAGGTLTLAHAGVAGDTLLIDRITPRSQTTDYQTDDIFPAETHEAALDRAMLIDQEQDALSHGLEQRALKVPVGETIEDLPPADVRAQGILGFDGYGEPIILPSEELGSVAVVAQRAEFTASAGDTTFATPSTYTVGYVTVYVNGVRLSEQEFTATDGALVVLDEPCAEGDIVALEGFLGAATVGEAGATTFQQAGPGAVIRSVETELRETHKITQFGAMPNDGADDTVAANYATGAALTYSPALYRGVHLPNGFTVIGTGNKSLYVRKGQTLSGEGIGASWIDGSALSLNTVPMIIFGEKSDGTDDPGGYCVEAHGFSTLGGSGTAAVIDTNNCAGWSVHDVFFSSPGTGLRATGGDGLVSDCFFDDGLNGLIVPGGNIIVHDNIFYLANQQITLLAGARDVQLNGNQHEYFKVYGVLFAGDNIKNISIRDSNFIQNQQFAASHAILLNGHNADLQVTGCTFRNLAGAGFKYASGVAGTIVIQDCIFDGLKTTATYAQSATMQGVDATNLKAIIRNCTFRNLPGQPIQFGGAEISSLTVENCRFENCTGGATEINIANSHPSSTVRIVNCWSSRGSAALFNQQATVPMFFQTPEFRGARAQLGGDIINAVFPYIVQWQAESFDTDGLLNIGTDASRFTIPPGRGITRVKLTAYIILANFNAGSLLLQIRKNETGTTDNKTVAGMAALFVFGTQPIMVATGVIDVVPGDFFDVRVYSPDTTTNIASAAFGSYFSIEILDG